MTPTEVALLAQKLDYVLQQLNALAKQNEEDHAEVKAALKVQSEDIDGLKLFRERIKGVLITIPTVVAIAAVIVAVLT